MLTAKFIDYLQFSIPYENMPFDGQYKRIRPLPFYKTGFLGEYGERYYMGNANSKNPLVVMSASALIAWDKFIEQREFLDIILNGGAKVSRIDLTMDCFASDDLIQAIDYIEWQLDGKIETSDTWNVPAKTISSWKKHHEETVEQIETVYFGDWNKRAKRGIVRVYDKGIDLGTYANSIIRLEIEDKRDKAQKTVERIADGASVGSAIKSRFNVNDDRFQLAIDAPDIDITRGASTEKPEKDTWAWLMKQVAPSLGKAIALDAINGVRANLDLFNEGVRLAYELELTELHNADDMQSQGEN